MLQRLLLGLITTTLLVACNNNATDSQESSAEDLSPKAMPETAVTKAQAVFDISAYAGKYASEDGDLTIILSEGMVIFELLVVSAQGRTGDLSAEIQLEENRGRYHNAAQDCDLHFEFAKQQIRLQQTGSCDMGMGVTGTGVYQSMTAANAALVVGEVGDSFGALFYAEDEASYQRYCQAGMEEWSGNIVCVAKEKSGADSAHIVHVFSGDYAGPDGELPPLAIAKQFTLSVTR